MEDSLPNNDYGYFCDATNTIKLARTVNSEHDGEVILSDEQVRNTFYHELFHVFQFYFNNEFIDHVYYLGTKISYKICDTLMNI